MRQYERSQPPILPQDFKHGLNLSVQGAVPSSWGGCLQYRNSNEFSPLQDQVWGCYLCKCGWRNVISNCWRKFVDTITALAPTVTQETRDNRRILFLLFSSASIMKGLYMYFFIIFPQSFRIIFWKHQTKTSFLQEKIAHSCPLIFIHTVQYSMWVQTVSWNGVCVWPWERQNLLEESSYKGLNSLQIPKTSSEMPSLAATSSPLQQTKPARYIFKSHREK